MKKNNGLRDLELPEEEELSEDLGSSEDSSKIEEFENHLSSSFSSKALKVLVAIKNVILRKEVLLGIVCGFLLIGVLLGAGEYFLSGNYHSASVSHPKVEENKVKSTVKPSASSIKLPTASGSITKTSKRKSAFPVPAPATNKAASSSTNAGTSTEVNANSDSASQSASVQVTTSAQAPSTSSTTPVEQAKTYQPVQVTYEHVDLTPFIGQPYQSVVKQLTEKGATVVVNFVLARNAQEAELVIDIKGENTTATLTVAWQE